MRENCKYGLMRGNRTSFTDDPKRAQSWKRRIQPRISLRNDEPVLYSTRSLRGEMPSWFEIVGGNK
jgi:hypothetical protein